MIKEVCVENFSNIPLAIDKGANRIELCDNLSVGGTTVSHGVAKKAIDYCKQRKVRLMAIIRPRGGNFVYNEDEMDIMIQDIIHFKMLGIEGIVIGCLTKDNWIDEKSMVRLLQEADEIDTTFHMAFDHIHSSRKLEAIDWLANHNVHRILTHGGLLNTTIEDNLPSIKNYIDYASDRIIIMPGGGITNTNLPRIAKTLGAKEYHGTKVLGELKLRCD